MVFAKCLIVACLAFGALAVPLNEEEDFLSGLQKYVKESDVEVTVPEGMSILSGTQFSFSPRNIDQDELSMTVKLPASAEAKSVGEARKGKLKKIIIPILVFVLLKAMTLVPLAIGVLGLKAWNALQLSFFSPRLTTPPTTPTTLTTPATSKLRTSPTPPTSRNKMVPAWLINLLNYY
ncbi:Hypothetical predicted protein [Cloeon dipterum]|uniref:Uncharacterized protein n=1 Tax=Cloeon dipterum TaxID=197152 RepID=A0A8S1CFL2_9INSE|nr:Hypothetical predicted protein [Cloeon dipterum]